MLTVEKCPFAPGVRVRGISDALADARFEPGETVVLVTQQDYQRLVNTAVACAYRRNGKEAETVRRRLFEALHDFGFVMGSPDQEAP